ncbi:ABC transporter permease [Brachybacterium sp. AOP43-C2-M15]|uniref:ABC transporter permease n=1 Tax=Brachybacterium sp. AOP43-C2-M15 TaxID=3457661 RepID=UPI00403407CD
MTAQARTRSPHRQEPVDPRSRRRPAGGPRALSAAVRAPGVSLSALFLALLLGWVVAPGVFATHHPLEVVGASLSPPGGEFWFGTDLNGRDVYSRVVHGARLSLLAGVVAVMISLVVGGLLGMIAGYAGGIVDAIISRAVEVLVSIPGLLLSLAIISVLGFGVDKVAIAVGIAGIPGMVRIARAETLRIVTLPYMDAATTSGTRRLTGIITHVVPNASGAIGVVAGIDLGGAILAVASLSFLGFGAVPPEPEWGSQINEGRMYIAGAWWWTLFPSVVAGLTVLSVNRLSRGIGTREVR